MNNILMKQKLEQFLLEDSVTNDLRVTTIFPISDIGSAVFQAKETGTLAGLAIIQATYQLLDSDVHATLFKKDGDDVITGEHIAKVTGPIQTILTGERVILNIIQRMSGIATMTKQVVQRLNNSDIQVCDTRKTTPGLRMFEKYAVTCGGGYNHRYVLYDGVMIKDNHIAFCGSIEKAVQKAREQLGPMVKIEVETESKEEVEAAVQAGCDVIMFDNQAPEVIFEWKKLVPETIITEASGNITLENIASYRDCGVNCISLGSLTHSVSSIDISLGVI